MLTFQTLFTTHLSSPPSNQLPASAPRNRLLAGSTDHMKMENLHQSLWYRFSSVIQNAFSLPRTLTSSYPAKLGIWPLYPVLPKYRANSVSKKRSHGGQVQFYQGPWQICTLWTEPVANPLQNSSPQLSKAVEGLQDIHVRLRFPPPTCHKNEISLQSCPGRYPAFSQYLQGQQTLVGTNGAVDLWLHCCFKH